MYYLDILNAYFVVRIDIIGIEVLKSEKRGGEFGWVRGSVS